MTKDDDNRTAWTIRKGIEFARLDRKVKREAQAVRAPTFSGRTFDKDPEEVTDAVILRRIRTECRQEDRPNGSATDALRHRLLQYSSIDGNNVDELLSLYVNRSQTKLELQARGFSNALAEAQLDRQGYPRPPGWHSVFFYPDSNRPRNSVIVWLLAGVGVAWAVITGF